MGLLLLILFVGASFALALRAWQASREHHSVMEAHPQREEEHDNAPLTIALLVIVLAGGVLSELLRHYTSLSVLMRAVFSIGFLATANACAYKFFEVRQERNPRSQISTRH